MAVFLSPKTSIQPKGLRSKQVESRCRIEISEVFQTRQKTIEAARREAELLLIVGIDEPERAPLQRVATVAAQPFEVLYRHSCPFDAQQFIDAVVAIAASPDNRLVERVRQQMDKGKFPCQTATNLLMAAERHLPRRETEENQSVGLQKRSDMLEKLAFVGFFDVFNDIVDEDEIEALVVGRRFLGENEILAEKRGFLACLGEKFACLRNARLTEVDARHLTADFGKGQQVSAFATTDFQHACLL